MSNEHCPDCGTPLEEVRDCRTHWVRPLKCPECGQPGFLEVADMKWIYPLQRLEYGVMQAIREADEATLHEAVSRIDRVDYKTVSIVNFEKHLLSCKTKKGS
jgi:ssDNA-binding Zn-finger/Zn-ribbon topoisomerase 1